MGSLSRTLRVTGVSVVVLLATVAAALALGVGRVNLWQALTRPASLSDSEAAILYGRAARVALGALVGAALAPAGVAFQAMLRNPLADPYVLGVSGGAAVTGTLALVLGLGAGVLGTWTVPVWAFGGAVVAILFVYSVGTVRGRLVPNVALLAGVVLNVLTAALVVLIRLVATPQQAHRALYWLTGTLREPEPMQLWVLLVYAVVGVGMLIWLAVPLNALALGEELAHTSGVSLERTRRLVFLAASLLTGAAVAFAGPIGFVGIVVPHALRGILGPDHRVLLPATALLGAAFVVAADTLTRLAFLWLETEPTVGVVTALFGAPFFLVVLRRRGAERVF